MLQEYTNGLMRCQAARSSAIPNEPETDPATSFHTAGFAPGRLCSTIDVQWFMASVKRE